MFTNPLKNLRSETIKYCFGWPTTLFGFTLIGFILLLTHSISANQYLLIMGIGEFVGFCVFLYTAFSEKYHEMFMEVLFDRGASMAFLLYIGMLISIAFSLPRLFGILYG